jgi:fumarate reductase subunit D
MADSPAAHEHREATEFVAHSFAEGGVKSAIIPLLIAVMALVAAAFGSLETTAVSSAVLARSDASIRQGEATDL